MRVNLRDKHERSESSIDIVALELRKPLAELAQETGANIKLVEDPPGPPVRATILAELYGPDYAQLRKIAKELRAEVFAKTADVVDIDDSSTDDVTEYRINVNREKATLAGILPAQVAETLQAFLAGYNVGTVHIELEKEPVPIRFQIPVADRVEPADLRKIFFANPQGRARVAHRHRRHRQGSRRPNRSCTRTSGRWCTSPASSPPPRRCTRCSRCGVTCAAIRLPGDVKLTQYFMGDPDTLGYSLRWDGEMRLTLDVFRDLGAAFMVALVLIYLVLVGYYRSFATPLIVMGAIPLTVIGVLPGHALWASTSPPRP